MCNKLLLCKRIKTLQDMLLEENNQLPSVCFLKLLYVTTDAEGHSEGRKGGLPGAPGYVSACRHQVLPHRTLLPLPGHDAGEFQLCTLVLSTNLAASFWLHTHVTCYTHTHLNCLSSSYLYCLATPRLHSETREESTSTARARASSLTSSSRDSGSSTNRRNPNSRYTTHLLSSHICTHINPNFQLACLKLANKCLCNVWICLFVTWYNPAANVRTENVLSVRKWGGTFKPIAYVTMVHANSSVMQVNPNFT